MAIDLILELGIKIVIALLFVLINSVVLRFVVVKLFRIKDDSFTTAMAVVVWISAALFLISYLNPIGILSWVLVIAANIFFVFLAKKEYDLDWNKALLVWLTWLAIFIAIGLVFLIIWMIIFS